MDLGLRGKFAVVTGASRGIGRAIAVKLAEEGAGVPPAYCAAKAALISHSKSLAVALAPQKIRVNTVAPGSIEFAGGLWEQAKHGNPEFYKAVLTTIPWDRMGTPGEVADVVAFLVSERASWVTGDCIAVDGAQHKANL